MHRTLKCIEHVAHERWLFVRGRWHHHKRNLGKKFNLFKSKVEFGDCVNVRFGGIFHEIFYTISYPFLWDALSFSFIKYTPFRITISFNLVEYRAFNISFYSWFFRHETFQSVISALFHIQSYLWQCAINWHAKNKENWIFSGWSPIKMKLQKKRKAKSQRRRRRQ